VNRFSSLFDAVFDELSGLLYFVEEFMTKLERLVTVMRDGQWYSTEDLVSRVGHRFSATKHVAQKQGYKFDVRREGTRFEYRMVPPTI
jgi:hypothetical protein